MSLTVSVPPYFMPLTLWHEECPLLSHSEHPSRNERRVKYGMPSLMFTSFIKGQKDEERVKMGDGGTKRYLLQ